MMILKSRGRRPRRRRGTVAVMMSVCLLPLVGVLAYTLDGGVLIGQRRRAQTVADASAHAAACVLSSTYVLYSGLDPQNKASSAAISVASANGYANDGTNTTVKVNIPPQSGPFKGIAGYAEVLVQLNQPRLFSAIWGSGTIPVSARAVGRVYGQPSSTMILLDPSTAGAFTASGSAKVKASAGIQVDSSNVGAINVNNSGNITAPTVSVTGNVTTSSSGTITGAVYPGSPTVADPLSTLAAPAAPTTAGSTFNPYGSATINPGLYSSGLTIGGGMTVTMNPGLYYLKGNGLSIANGATVSGSGVTIYIASGSGQVSFQGGGTINLSSATTGTYAGIMIFQDRSNTSPISIANGSSTTLGGTVYAPSAAASFAGGATFQINGQFISKTINVSNNANIQVTSNVSGGTRSVNLVE